nr:hypothetical protein [uncultured Allomuricauda sp.]
MPKFNAPFILIFTFFSILCCKENKRDLGKVKFNDSEEFKTPDSILAWSKTLLVLNSNSEDFENQATQLNKRIKSAFSGLKDTSQLNQLTKVLINNNEKYGVVLAQTTDGRLRLFTWDTRLGGSMKMYENCVLTENRGEVQVNEIENKSVLYNKIYTFANSTNQSIYLFSGSGKSSGYEFFHHLQAFSIEKGKLEAKSIFPDGKNDWNNPFSIENGYSNTKLGFIISENGIEISKSSPLPNGTMWHQYIFDGKEYIPKKYSPKNQFNETSFDIENEYQFIKGSEVPSYVESNEDRKEYSFEDDYTVVETAFQVGKKPKIPVLNNPDGKKEIQVSKQVRLIGKSENFIFLDSGGVPEDWLLHIYDINQQKIILSKYVAKAMLQDELLIFSELSNTINSGCENESFGHFKINVLHYRQDFPTLQPTGQSYCSYIQ